MISGFKDQGGVLMWWDEGGGKERRYLINLFTKSKSDINLGMFIRDDGYIHTYEYIHT